jgi:hypothetical protein
VFPEKVRGTAGAGIIAACREVLLIAIGVIGATGVIDAYAQAAAPVPIARYQGADRMQIAC